MKCKTRLEEVLCIGKPVQLNRKTSHLVHAQNTQVEKD